MDLAEQDQIVRDVEKLLFSRLDGKRFHTIISIDADEGRGLIFSVGNLSDESTLGTCKTIGAGIKRHSELFLQNLKIPDDVTFKKPAEVK